MSAPASTWALVGEPAPGPGTERRSPRRRAPPQDEREHVKSDLEEVLRSTASLRRDFARARLTNAQRGALEGSPVFRDTELGSLVEDSEAAGLPLVLLAQVRGIMGGGGSSRSSGVFERVGGWRGGMSGGSFFRQALRRATLVCHP